MILLLLGPIAITVTVYLVKDVVKLLFFYCYRSMVNKDYQYGILCDCTLSLVPRGFGRRTVLAGRAIPQVRPVIIPFCYKIM